MSADERDKSQRQGMLPILQWSAVAIGDSCIEEGPISQEKTFDAYHCGELFLAPQRPLWFDPRELLADKDAKETIAEVVFSTLNPDRACLPYTVRCRDGFEIDPARVGETGALEFRLNGDTPAELNSRYRLDLNLRVAAAPLGNAPRKTTGHLIGDSLTFFHQPMMVHQKLSSLGYDVKLIGTMQCQGGEFTTSSFRGEGRRGRQWADYIYKSANDLKPLPAGEESTYLQAHEGVKEGINPYLRPSTADDPHDLVCNGYVFDMRYYLDRFGFEDPDWVRINLGRNDMLQQTPAVALQQASMGFWTLYRQIRQALPKAHIAFAFSGDGFSSWSIQDWRAVRWPMMLALGEWVRKARESDSGVWLLMTHAHMMTDTDFRTEVVSQDHPSALSRMTIVDCIHPVTGSPVHHQMAEVDAAWVNYIMTQPLPLVSPDGCAKAP